MYILFVRTFESWSTAFGLVPAVTGSPWTAAIDRSMHTNLHTNTHTLWPYLFSPHQAFMIPLHFLWSSEHQSLIPQSRNEGKGDDKKRDDRLLAIYRGGFAPLPLFIFSPRPEDTGYTFWFPTMQMDFHTASNVQWFPLNHFGEQNQTYMDPWALIYRSLWQSSMLVRKGLLLKASVTSTVAITMNVFLER